MKQIFNQLLLLFMVFASIAGIADASYLTYEKFSNVIPVCGDGFDCGAVLNSQYANIGPIPISAFGILFYTTVLALVVLLFLDIGTLKIKKVSPISTLDLLSFVTSSGFAFSIVLVGLMAFVIKAWCLFCLISAATSTALFIATGLIRITTKKS